MVAGSNPKEITYRLALVSAGAIALGAYEAGVLAQLYHDLQVFNRVMKGQTRILIDAIAGSSAGSLTGLILARAIALEHDPQTFANEMWRAWVERADIVVLLAPHSSASESVFTRESVQDVAAEAVPEVAPDPSFDPGRVVALWMTMTNLDGIPEVTSFPRATPGQPEVRFYSLAYRDYAPYLICGSALRYVTVPTEALLPPGLEAWMARLGRTRYQAPSAPTLPSDDWWWYSKPATWAEAREHAITSGSVPLAFQSRPVRRDLTLYPRYTQFRNDANVQKQFPKRPLPDQATFQCGDGGVFNNQPIGRAIDAVSYLENIDPSRDPETNPNTHRVFLVIEPDPNTPKQVAALLSSGNAATPPDGLMPPTLVSKMISAFMNDALYADFQQAVDTNRQLEQLAALTMSKPPLLDPAQLQAVKEALEMGYKRIITLEHIPYSPVLGNRLAGGWAGHFGGFLRKDLRAADFKTGQYEARQWFLTWLQANLPALAIQPAQLDDGLTPPPAGYSPLGNPPNPHIDDSPLSRMNWNKLGFWRRAAISWSGLLRGLWLAFRWFWPVMLVLAVLVILAAFGLYSLANAYGWGIYLLAWLVVLAPFAVLELLDRRSDK